MTAYMISVFVLLGTIVSSRFINPELETYFNKIQAKYNSKLDLNRIQKDIPVVGILTMPRDDRDFPYKHFNWEHNVNFV